jgi:single-stranded DNA-binding protein
MSTILQGFITDIFPFESPTPSFTKRVLWLKQGDRERSPQHWEVEFVGEDGKRLDEYRIGDEVKVEVDIRGRRWDGGTKGMRIFTSLKAVGMSRVTTPDRAYNPKNFNRKEEDADPGAHEVPNDDNTLPF